MVSRGSKNQINDEHALTENIRHLTATLVPSRGCLEGRQSFLEKLNGILRQELPGFKAELFGSTVNGLGMASSDVDVALIGQQQSDPSQLIKEFARKLRNYGMLHVYTISMAKVPICKFYDPEW
jgi:DNA polymerase sigma